MMLRRPALLLVAGLLFVGPGTSAVDAAPAGDSVASDATPQAVAELLDQLQVEEAIALLEQVPPDRAGRALVAAALAFHRGDYERATELLPAPGRSPKGLERRLGWLHARLPGARSANRGMVEETTEHFVYRYQPGPDAVLAEYAGPALEGQREAMKALQGEAPELPIVVEFFPDQASFVQASGLPREWVETTGTVAICKWDRILVLSPRNMAWGYPWKDTLAHEYVHLALARASKDRAPVWFHEGSAKLLESAWRDPQRRDFIGPWAESLLALALREDALISFDAMHPSMAALPSSEAAALAFAQVAWAVQYVFEEAGEAGYREIVEETARNGDVLAAVSQVLGQPAGAFEASVHGFLKQQNFKVRANIAGIDLDLEEGAASRDDPEGQSLDPVLKEHRAMQDHARIGDLLRLRGRLDAAIIEYQRAERLGPFHSPSLANKQARALRGLGRLGQARQVLEASVALYPEFTPTVALLAEIAAAEGDTGRAVQMGERAVGLNPFDPNIHLLLQQAYARGGRQQESKRERRVLDVLGVPTESPSGAKR